MSRWPGKYVIGLTGNISTGKSVVRKMLEHLGAYGIDADALSHRAMAKGAPGYPLVLKSFGEWILDDEEQIDRAKLGKVVFADPAALERLERVAQTDENTVPAILECVESYCTLGEISGVFRSVFGEQEESFTF